MKNQVPQKFFQVGKVVEKIRVEENFLIRKNNLKIGAREFFFDTSPYQNEKRKALSIFFSDTNAPGEAFTV